MAPEHSGVTQQNGRMPHIAETKTVSAIFVIPLSGRIVNIMGLMGLMEYFEGTLHSRNTDEQNLVLLKNLMTEMRNDNIIRLDGKTWFSID